jgi:hypothetical protein
MNMIDPFSPAALGLSSGDASPGGGTQLGPRPEPGLARSAVIGQPGISSVDNPLVWFGIILGVTAGAIGFATSARVGPVRAAVGVGKK